MHAVIEPSAILGPVRRTVKRVDSPPETTNSYSNLLSTVREQGLLRRTPGFYLGLFSVLLIALAGAIATLLLLGDSWAQLFVAAALGLIFTQFAFLAHETSHRQVFASGRANDRAGRILAAGVVGISYAWWMTKHSRHHANPNTVGKDPDIEVDTVSFLEEDASQRRGFLRALTRRQGYLFFPLLLLEGLNLHALSFRTVFGRGKVAGRAVELVLLFARFALYFGLVFWVLPVALAFAFIGVQLAVFGLYMGASFAPNHKGMPIIEAGVKVDFLSKQVLTSRNIRGVGMATFMGGLNYQIEHHLFPNMPRPHLRQAAAIVREHCETENIAYTETTLLQSYGIVVQYLNRVGLAARDPFDCPVAGEYRRR
ncbi:MAG TPA: acyl-CoA desaturase [Leifsonia sp.]|jgi:fatty acid desaturase|nr:acyl-CoA desaturase [Leifsonia sp.]